MDLLALLSKKRPFVFVFIIAESIVGYWGDYIDSKGEIIIVAIEVYRSCRVKTKTVIIKRPYRFRISKQGGAALYFNTAKAAIRDIIVRLFETWLNTLEAKHPKAKTLLFTRLNV